MATRAPLGPGEPRRGGSRCCSWSGSFLFALGSFPPYAQLVDPGTVGITFVVGSVFFTCAAVGQLVQTRASRIRAVSDRRCCGRLRCSSSARAVQRQHHRRHAREPRHRADQPARLGAGPVRLDRLPGRQPPGVARRVPPALVRPTRRRRLVGRRRSTTSVRSSSCCRRSPRSSLPTTGEALNTTVVNSRHLPRAPCASSSAPTCCCRHVHLPAGPRSAVERRTSGDHGGRMRSRTQLRRVSARVAS